MSEGTPKRYSALWVTLHWTIALLLLAEFTLGISSRYIQAAGWASIMKWHIPLGISILALMILRIVVRSSTPHPEPASAGSPLLDKVGVLTHYLLYFLVILLPLAGLAQAIAYNLIPVQPGAALNLIVQFGSLHRWIALALGLLIALHISAAIYHEAIRKDHLLSRMWFANQA